MELLKGIIYQKVSISQIIMNQFIIGIEKCIPLLLNALKIWFIKLCNFKLVFEDIRLIRFAILTQQNLYVNWLIRKVGSYLVKKTKQLSLVEVRGIDIIGVEGVGVEGMDLEILGVKFIGPGLVILAIFGAEVDFFLSVQSSSSKTLL